MTRSAQQWIDEQVQECVYYALAIRRALSSGRNNVLDGRLLSEVGRAIGKLPVYPDEECRGNSLQRSHLDDIRYACVALLGEFAQISPDDHRWQDELLRGAGFPIEPIGEHFYRRLDQRLDWIARAKLGPESEDVRREREANLAVVRLYALFIGLGFRGRFGASVGADLDKLQGYLQRVYKMSGRFEEKSPPVRAYVPSSAPSWSEARILLAVVGFFALIVLSGFFSLSKQLTSAADGVREILSRSESSP